MKENKVKLSMTFDSTIEERIIAYQKSQRYPSKSYTANRLLEEILTQKDNSLTNILKKHNEQSKARQ